MSLILIFYAQSESWKNIPEQQKENPDDIWRENSDTRNDDLPRFSLPRTISMEH